jgi:glucosylceramidase
MNDGFDVSRRLWAFAGFFRFARPGAVRVDATSSAENMYVSAFINTNGTVAVPVINEAHYERSVAVNLAGCQLKVTKATVYLADNDHNNTMPVDSFRLNGTSFLASVPPRSMTTFFLE